jgi:cell division protein FtsN
MPGRPVVETGSFYRRDAAARQAAQLASLGARVELGRPGQEPPYRVRIGPFADRAAADRAVGEALRAGLPEVRLLIE